MLAMVLAGSSDYGKLDTDGSIDIDAAKNISNALWVDARGSKELLTTKLPMTLYFEKGFEKIILRAQQENKILIFFCTAGCSKSKEIRLKWKDKFPMVTMYYLLGGDLSITGSFF